MNYKEAVTVLKESQDWRRSIPPYDEVDGKEMPHSPKRFGVAIDIAINILTKQNERNK